MLLLKGCPKCRGDLHINEDMYGEYKKCVQCGYMEDIEKRRGKTIMAKIEKAA